MTNDDSPRQPLRLASDEQVLQLIRSGQRSQHRRRSRRLAASVAASAVVVPLLAWCALSFWPRPAPLAPSLSAPLVARQASPAPSLHTPTAPATPTATPSTAPATSAVPSPAPRPPLPSDQQSLPPQSAPSQSLPADTLPVDALPAGLPLSDALPVDPLFAEIQSREYSTILWNNRSDADTIVSRLNQLFDKKGV